MTPSINLNQHRILIGRVALGLAFLLNLLTASRFFPSQMFFHHVWDSIGLILIVSCILGRVYCTLQIGGKKRETVVSTGIYSVVRHPLYFFSFIGAVGIGLVSNQITVLVLLTAGFLLVYLPLIGREEAFLQDKFGDVYASYIKKVPRFIPNFNLYTPPPEGSVTINMATLHSALRDALWWLLPFIIFELIEWAQTVGLIHPLASIW